MENPTTETGFTPQQQLPQIDNAKIWFIERENNMRFEGLWVAAEEMFFITFIAC